MTGIPYYSSLTDKALSLYDYQYHGIDPDLKLSKYRSRSKAVYDIQTLLKETVRIVEEHVKSRLEKRGEMEPRTR